MKIATRLFALLLVCHASISTGFSKNLSAHDEALTKGSGQRPFILDHADRGLIRPGAAISTDDRFGVPVFIWAAPGTGSHGRSASHELSARAHLARYAHLYGLSDDNLKTAITAGVHDIGRGGIVVSFQQQVGGVDVFRNQIRILMNRDHELVAVSGYLRGAGAAHHQPGRFDLRAEEAVARAVGDYASDKTGRIDPSAFQSLGFKPGGFESFGEKGLELGRAGLTLPEPVRAKKVMYDLPDGMEPAWYVEIVVGSPDSQDADYYAYVISAVDGRVLFRHNQTASDSFSYRVWADATGLRIPQDGPQSNLSTPHPTGTPDGYQAPFASPGLVTLQNGPISTNDPWLAPGATTTQGNNTQAYADLVAPDGFGAGDIIASTTSAGVFDRTYNTALAPGSSQTQRMAAVTQLFYDINFLHDWFYDAGFNEISGNAQTNNYGRGGFGNDSIRAEAQDHGGKNNANMSTPSDGGRPRMQMFIWDGNGINRLTIDAPGAIAGIYQVGTAAFGPTAFTRTADIVRALDGTGTTTDACEPITSAVSGRIAFIDRGTCTFAAKIQNAQTAGAFGVIIANVASSVSPTVPPAMGGTPTITITIGSLSLNLADGDLIRAQFGGTVHGTIFREAVVDRDGTIDNQIVAHEWGHYISNRLVGNSSGLNNNQGGGLGEGWGDFHALLQTIRAEDASAPSGANWTGAYGLAGYVSSGGVNDGYYYGIRRYPYSTELGRNALMFRHIGAGAPLTGAAPVQFGAPGVNNAEVHHTGEVWTTMLLECYAALLRDPRYTFDQAQGRMIDYLVAGYKLTPSSPTVLEARDAILSTALANDFGDYLLFLKAFARRGAGHLAVAPDRGSFGNQGAVESFQPAIDHYFVGATLDDAVSTCDNDGVLDNDETGHLTFTLRNVGNIPLNATTVTITTTNTDVSFPAGNVVAMPPMAPGATVVRTVDVALAGAAGPQQIDFTISWVDPAFRIPGPASAVSSHRSNLDDAAGQTATDDVESGVPRWTTSGTGGVFKRIGTPYAHSWLGPDVNNVSDLYLVSPVLNVAPAGSFSFSFSHRYIFVFLDNPITYYDGGVIEISTNGGGSWADIGASASQPYTGILASGASNPIQGRQAYAGFSPGYPVFQTVTVNLGSAYQGQSVLIRFRVGSDTNGDNYGWEIDNIVFNNVTNLPFNALINENGICPDGDGDGVGDFTDCAPANSSVWSVPSVTQDLTLTGGVVASLSWQPPVQPGSNPLLYDLLRSESGSSFTTATCVESGGTDLSATDAATPSAVFYYLLRSKNLCGGNLGTASNGASRTGVNCP